MGRVTLPRSGSGEPDRQAAQSESLGDFGRMAVVAWTVSAWSSFGPILFKKQNTPLDRIDL